MKEKFLKEKQLNERLSLSSIRSYESLFYHIERDKNFDFSHIEETFTLSNVLNFFQKNSHKWKDSTYNFYIKKFRVFLKFLHREEKIWKFYETLKFKKTDKKIPKHISLEDLEKIFKILDPEEQRIIRFFLFTGVRRFEFANIERKNIFLKKWEIIIFWKWRKERIIPIHQNLIKDIAFMNFPYSLKKIDNLRMKIQKKFPDFKLHNLRHTFATTMIKNNADIYSLAQIMWHASIDTTTIYLSLNIEKAKKEIAKFNLSL